MEDQCPLEDQNFSWHAPSNNPAFKVKRVMHHQATLGMCSVCGMEDENMFHALVTCPKARASYGVKGSVENSEQRVFQYLED